MMNHAEQLNAAFGFPPIPEKIDRDNSAGVCVSLSAWSDDTAGLVVERLEFLNGHKKADAWHVEAAGDHLNIWAA